MSPFIGVGDLCALDLCATLVNRSVLKLIDPRFY